MSEAVLVHPILAAALSAMHASYVHKAPIHLGGPPPVVPRRGQAVLPLWCAEIVQPLVARARAGPYQQALGLARKVVETRSADALASAREVRAALGRDPADPASMAGLAVAGAAHVAGDLRNATRAARVAAQRMVHLLEGPRRPGLPSPREFLEALDERLLLLEVRAGVARRSRAAAERITAIVYRSSTTAGGAGAPPASTTVILVRLGDAWGTLVRRSGFHWAEGDRQHALALVPDEQFAAAVEAAVE
jgi:hypothetical protein